METTQRFPLSRTKVHGHLDNNNFEKDIEPIKFVLRTKNSKKYDLKVSEVAPYFREPGILSGYRASDQSWKFYLYSLFYWHNETINIWSHLLGSIGILGYSYYLNVEGIDQVPLRCFGWTGFLFMSMSWFAHAFHSSSVKVHRACFLVDYIGIGVYGFGYSTLIYGSCSEPNYREVIGVNVFMWINAFLGTLTCLSQCIAMANYHHLRLLKKIIQLSGPSPQIIWGCFPLIHRCYVIWVAPESSIFDLGHYINFSITFFVAIFFFASHLPDKCLPGKCDYFCQGHSIFHVLIVFSCKLMLDASILDSIKNLTQQNHFIEKVTYSLFGITFGLYLIIGILIALTVFYKLYFNNGKEKHIDLPL